MTQKEYIKKLEKALYDSLTLNINWVSTALYSDLEFHSEYESTATKRISQIIKYY